MDIFKNNEIIQYIVNQYADTIIRVTFSYTKNMSDAQDLTQEVFISLMKQPAFKTEEHLKAWLIRVAINKSKDFLRSVKRKSALPLDDFAETLSEKQKLVLDELDELSDYDRKIIYLFYYERYTAKEIAKIIDSKERAVLMRLSRAREKLKHLLEDRNE
ncbi:MAG: sigma-70 family RNA polymerase sigma factor [Firmicutes bacterium]|nr:sigma-70 family RNA polymerase sigma factor [Bacillota bacterium]